MSHIDFEAPLFQNKPHIWIQWKGTNVCCDIHCACGAHLHYDGDFMYYVECPHCKQKWEIGTHVTMYPVDVPDDTPTLCHPLLDDRFEVQNGS